MDREKRFIFIPRGVPNLSWIFDDFYMDPRVDYLEHSCSNLNSAVLKKIRRIHLARRLNDIIELPLKSKWGCSLADYPFKPGIDYYVLFMECAPYPVAPEIINSLKEQYGLKYILLMVDPFETAKLGRYYIERVKFDYIFSYSFNDVKNHGFLMLNEFYSKLNLPDETLDGEVKYDLLYIGKNKRDRLDILHSIYQACSKVGISCSLSITNVPKNKQLRSSSIVYNKFIPYEQLIRKTVSSNCVLEVATLDDTSATLRYFEAVCYNKKLLTNNKNIKNLPFYNPQYMQYFEKPEDIDYEWVRERIPVDYGYDGSFSPSRLIDKIIDMEDEKAGVTIS